MLSPVLSQRRNSFAGSLSALSKAGTFPPLQKFSSPDWARLQSSLIPSRLAGPPPTLAKTPGPGVFVLLLRFGLAATGQSAHAAIQGEDGTRRPAASQDKAAADVIVVADNHKNYKKGDWNDYVIIAKGNHLVHYLNGIQTVDVIDNDPKNSALSGILALQIHQGQPMIVQFKNVRLKQYAKTRAN